MTNETRRHGYLVKYALTEGIIECELISSCSDGMWHTKSNRYISYHEKPDVRWTREDAIAELNKRIAAKRKSIENQLVKLDKLAALPKFTTEAKVWPERKS